MPERQRLYALVRAAAALLGLGEAVAERVRLEAGQLLLEELYRFNTRPASLEELIEGLRGSGVDESLIEELRRVGGGVGETTGGGRGEPDGG